MIDIAFMSYLERKSAMFFKNYNYFITIVECNSITRAAETLFLSQPSLSKYLRRLEQNLGVELFDHHASPLKLTYAGKRYYEYIKRIQAMDRQFDEELSGLRNNEIGEIRIGIAQWRGAIMLPTIIPAFHEHHPGWDIILREGRAVQVENALIQGEVDICLMNFPSHFPNQTIQETLWSEKCLLVGNRKHPIVRKAIESIPIQKDGYRHIDIAFLENEHFISLQPGQNMTVATDRLFALQNIRPRKIWQTENMSTALNMVSKTMSFTIMPDIGAKTPFLPDNLEFFSIEHSEELLLFGVVYRKSFVLNKQIHTLLNITKSIYKQ